MVKVLKTELILSANRVGQVAWCSGRPPRYWQAAAIILIHKTETGLTALTQWYTTRGERHHLRNTISVLQEKLFWQEPLITFLGFFVSFCNG